MSEQGLLPKIFYAAFDLLNFPFRLFSSSGLFPLLETLVPQVISLIFIALFLLKKSTALGCSYIRRVPRERAR